MNKCQICNNISSPLPVFENRKPIKCKICGCYSLIDTFMLDIYEDKSNFYKVSSWIREKNDECEKNGTKKYPALDKEYFDKILGMREKSIQEKFDLMMINLSLLKESKELNLLFRTRCWFSNNEEFKINFQQAIDKHLIEGSFLETSRSSHAQFIRITFDGRKYIESLDQPNKSSKKIFCAFNFTDEIKKIFDSSVRDAIEELGYIYTIVTLDTTKHDQTINDEIIAKLKSSKIVIADFTNQRNSVYFEAGFAMGMKIPVIWTCKKDPDEKLSFDTRQFPHIYWKDGEDLKQQILNRIKVMV